MSHKADLGALFGAQKLIHFWGFKNVMTWLVPLPHLPLLARLPQRPMGLLVPMQKMALPHCGRRWPR